MLWRIDSPKRIYKIGQAELNLAVHIKVPLIAHRGYYWPDSLLNTFRPNFGPEVNGVEWIGEQFYERRSVTPFLIIWQTEKVVSTLKSCKNVKRRYLNLVAYTVRSLILHAIESTMARIMSSGIKMSDMDAMSKWTDPFFFLSGLLPKQIGRFLLKKNLRFWMY